MIRCSEVSISSLALRTTGGAPPGVLRPGGGTDTGMGGMGMGTDTGAAPEAPFDAEAPAGGAEDAEGAEAEGGTGWDWVEEFEGGEATKEDDIVSTTVMTLWDENDLSGGGTRSLGRRRRRAV